MRPYPCPSSLSTKLREEGPTYPTSALWNGSQARAHDPSCSRVKKHPCPLPRCLGLRATPKIAQLSRLQIRLQPGHPDGALGRVASTSPHIAPGPLTCQHLDQP